MGARKIDRSEAIRLRRQGWSVRQIAEHFGVLPGSIRTALGEADYAEDKPVDWQRIFPWNLPRLVTHPSERGDDA